MKNLIKYSELSDVNRINQLILEGKSKDIIDICEEKHESEINAICQVIEEKDLPIVLVTGPSSSGKTTFSNRLSNKLKKPPLVLSIDDFFYGNDEIDKSDTTVDFFESLAAVNVSMFNSCVYSLLSGKETAIPRFDFENGRSIKENKIVKLKEDQEIIVEGIHAFNDALIPDVSACKKYSIYIHLGTDVEIDGEIISKQDMRLVRRSIRDQLFRGCEVKRTQHLWKGVISFEKDNIIPYMPKASKVFNSFLPYEPAITGALINKFLKNIPLHEDLIHISDIAKKLEKYEDLDKKLVPEYSILKEFIGDFE